MTIIFRPGTPDDSYAVFRVFLAAVTDLGVRIGAQGITGGDDPAVLADLWEQRRPLFEHLARTADQWWVAEHDGEVVGYARSILRETTRELTEFFVLPGQQSAGVGRELLARAFPKDGASNRTIVATIDRRALARYLKTGVTTRFPIAGMSRAPQAAPMPETDLSFLPIAASPETLDALGEIDAAILGCRRDADHAYLLAHRRGYFATRARQVVGYLYAGYRSGPVALLDPDDFPAVLAFTETSAAEQGFDSLTLDVPMSNRVAMQYLLARGFALDAFITFFLSDHPVVGMQEHYILTTPPFFV